jgi:hypothetical protein
LLPDNCRSATATANVYTGTFAQPGHLRSGTATRDDAHAVSDAGDLRSGASASDDADAIQDAGDLRSATSTKDEFASASNCDTGGAAAFPIA